jgi:5-oxoprolinase (ATP-hydrolysing)
VCYRKGGHLAVTDANLQLGRIVPESFPHIFGPTEDQPLDVEATRGAFAALAGQVNAFYGASGVPPKSTDEIAFGFLQVANEAMCRPIRALTQMRGYDITTHVLACFGGAGPQHACAIARALGMRRIFISRFSGILSAYGISLADVVNEAQAPVSEVLAPHEPAEAAVRAARAASGLGGVELTPTDLAFACSEPQHIDGRVASQLAARLQGLAVGVADRLLSQRFSASDVIFELFVNLRYRGTDTAIMVPAFIEEEAAAGAAGAGASAAASAADAVAEAEEDGAVPISSGSSLSPNQLPLAAVLGAGYAPGATAARAEAAAALPALVSAVRQAVRRFLRAYQREFGFVLQHRDVLVDDVRVRGIARGAALSRPVLPPTAAPLPAPAFTKSVFFEGGRVETPVYALADLQHGHTVPGPAMLIDKTSTIVVERGFTASVTPGGDVEVNADAPTGPTPAEAAAAAAPAPPPPAASALSPLAASLEGDAFADVPADPIQLSIFSHRFMGIAEQMGRVLQRTSISVNMRERLDYSCALFGPDGGLVANAPHIPVHLGAMQEAVKFQMGHWGADLAEGDVLVSNHPQLAGGSHLPDITVITPVFDGGRIVFFVASRGHHADIGGIAPGSMPPTSKSLREEGAAIVAFKLVQGGEFQEAGITELLMAPAKSGIPGCAGSRNLPDCLSDLRAQVAANHKGITLVKGLIAEYSLRVVTGYMFHIQRNAEVAVREMLVRFSLARGLPPVGTVRAVDHMDDGTPIALAITVDRNTRSATFDFTGTGSEVFGNTNAPRAVTYSAIIYSLRCLVGSDVPLNQGCLAPVAIHIPAGTLLHPSPDAAVVGGNVLTSQRVVDVILKAFGAAAASQGCMNNLTMGNASFGFYETIAGGSGAGPTWAGRSGVQTHMTNTRATDPEIFERRYPVLLRANTLRSGSGGAGANPGGEGVYRSIQFRIPLTVSILSERRAFRPYGLAGGGPGARGANTLIRTDGRAVNLGGKATVQVEAGDMLRIETPGGGGFGRAAGAAAAAGDAAAVAAAAAREVEREAEEYGAAYAAATGRAPPALGAGEAAAPHGEADVVGGAAPGAGADPAAFPFSASVGRYKETQETN